MTEENRPEEEEPTEWNERQTNLLFTGHMAEMFFGKDEDGNIIPKIFYGEFLSLVLQQVKHIVVLRRTKEIYIYNEENGKYEGGNLLGKQLLYELIHHILGQYYREHRAKQVYESIITTEEIVKYREELNPPLHLIGFENGILDISSVPYKFLPHNPKYFYTNFLTIDYDPTATCEDWLKFLNSSFRPDDIIFLQQWVGSCFLREIKPPNWKAVMLHGPTKTGKSTFTHVLHALFGETSVIVPLHKFQDKYERFRLYGKLLNAVADISSTELHDTSYFKRIVAGDKISARTLYLPSVDFIPYTKHLFSCNLIPSTWDDSGAFFERWRLVLVNLEQFLDTNPNQIKDLLTRLTTKESLSGILNWALEGLQKYLKQGYYSNCPDKEETRRLWNLFTDPQTAFMSSNWVRFIPTVSETKEEFHQHFIKFCESKGITPWNKIRFGRMLKKNYVKTGALTETRETPKDGEQVPCWAGIKIIPQTNEQRERQAKELAEEREREARFDRIMKGGKP
jgi:putative DNA primase/helicase